MVEKIRSRMTEWDWRKMGHSPEKYQHGELLTRRLFIALPETKGDVRNLFYAINALANDINEAMKGEDVPRIIRAVDDAIYGARLTLEDHKRAWEQKLKDRQADQSNVEQLRNIR